MNIKTCNTCSYFIDDSENGADCGSINGCIYDNDDNDEQKIKEKDQSKTEDKSLKINLLE